jgi:hypothetical protein
MRKTNELPGCHALAESGVLASERLFEFGTVGEMILAASAYTLSLAGEVSIVRVALGKVPVHDPFDASAALAPGR